MAHSELERRVADLEAEVARLKDKVQGPADEEVPWWDRIAGSFADDPVYEEAMRLGREYRESQRPKPRTRKKQ